MADVSTSVQSPGGTRANNCVFAHQEPPAVCSAWQMLQGVTQLPAALADNR